MKEKIIEGVFQNGIQYLKMGSAKEVAVLFLGGPGNTLPRGLAAAGFAEKMTLLLVRMMLKKWLRK